jgi:hypothetical protein
MNAYGWMDEESKGPQASPQQCIGAQGSQWKLLDGLSFLQGIGNGYGYRPVGFWPKLPIIMTRLGYTWDHFSYNIHS